MVYDYVLSCNRDYCFVIENFFEKIYCRLGKKINGVYFKGLIFYFLIMIMLKGEFRIEENNVKYWFWY